MHLERLGRRAINRLWGCKNLPGGFSSLENGQPIGEIAFEGSAASDLLVKYIFTNDRLSIQVHPTPEHARAKGLSSGKDEAWYVLEAAPDAVIGLGFTRDLNENELRSALADGSIENLIAWTPVRAGDSFFAPSGTVHALGGGLKIIEIQQSADVTYRLYDYGRPRELHVEEALAVSSRTCWQAQPPVQEPAPNRRVLACGEFFTVEHCSLNGGHLISSEQQVLLVPLTAGARVLGTALEPGEVYVITGNGLLLADAETQMLISYPSREVQVDLLTDLEPRVWSSGSRAPERPVSTEWPANKERRASRRFRA